MTTVNERVPMTTEPTTVADEIAAMRRIVVALDKLDPNAQDRIVTWLWDRYRDGQMMGEAYAPNPDLDRAIQAWRMAQQRSAGDEFAPE